MSLGVTAPYILGVDATDFEGNCAIHYWWSGVMPLIWGNCAMHDGGIDPTDLGSLESTNFLVSEKV